MATDGHVNAMAPSMVHPLPPTAGDTDYHPIHAAKDACQRTTRTGYVA